MPRANPLNDMLESIFKAPRDGSICVTCKSIAVKPEDFRDDLSRKEFSMSFMCQKCQDDVFSVLGEEERAEEKEGAEK